MRADASARGRAEFNAFGPWIDEVHTAEQVPPLFDGYPLDLEAARLVLKVPRNIPRRDAHAGMDLYDHLVVLRPDALTVLSRVREPVAPGGQRYTEVTLGCHDVVAVRDAISLLDGTLQVRGRDGTSLSFGYNGSAAETTELLVDELRSAMAPTAPDTATAAGVRGPELPGPAVLGQADIGIVTSYRQIARRTPGLRVLAMHRRQVVLPLRENAGATVLRALHLIAPMILHAVIVATDGTFLEVIGRSAGLARGRTPAHSRSRLVLPLAAIDSVGVVPHPVYAQVSLVTLIAGRTRVELTVPAGGDAERALSGLPRG
jgi:hypothetical protein